MDAAQSGVAIVGSTDLAVIAVRGLPSLADPLRAGIVLSARVEVIAVAVQRCVLALACQALVCSTRIGIIAVESISGNATAVHALVARRTGVAILARGSDHFVAATSLWQAVVLGAWVSVVTLKRARTLALPVDANVVHRAFVEVIALAHRHFVEATRIGLTLVVSAGIAIIAIKQVAAPAHSQAALVSHRADVAIVARLFVDEVHTSKFRVTSVIRAGIVIIALKQLSYCAGAVGTSLPEGAEIAVIALAGGGAVDAALLRIAGICCARVAVITGQRLTSHAHACRALV